mmetsp:Transcript_34395/g.97553  ORF Transcript_34395/g.97553 Transcript_34395/m.97553 type:complete len:265 (-) Transcript_34395:72-866(-)
MCGLVILPSACSCTLNVNKEECELQLQIVGALSGAVVLGAVAASRDWSVRRLRAAIARQDGSGAHLNLLFDSRLLDDAEVLSSFLPPDQLLHSLLLVRDLQPKDMPARALAKVGADARVVVRSEGEAVSTLHWCLDKRVLSASGAHHTSQTFQLSLGPGHGEVPFKLAIFATNGSFKKSRGRGYVQLKCMGEVPAALADVELSASAAAVAAEGQVEDGVCRHNFALAVSAKLPRRGDIDFAAVVDEITGSFEITVELVRRSGGN